MLLGIAEPAATIVAASIPILRHLFRRPRPPPTPEIPDKEFWVENPSPTDDKPPTEGEAASWGALPAESEKPSRTLKKPPQPRLRGGAGTGRSLTRRLNDVFTSRPLNLNFTKKPSSVPRPAVSTPGPPVPPKADEESSRWPAIASFVQQQDDDVTRRHMYAEEFRSTKIGQKRV